MGTMAKAKKAARKSASSSTKKKAPAKAKKTPKKPSRKPVKKTAKKEDTKLESPEKAEKKPELICQYCEKPMKDSKTKKVHERNCKNKQKDKVEKIEKKEKDLESTVLKLKDEFEVQSQKLADHFSDRESRLHDEIRELKEVLRMEIEHRYKERDRQKKEEVATAEPAAEESPKAIDQIPMQLPEIPPPKEHAQPPTRAVEVVEVGAIEKIQPVAATPQPVVTGAAAVTPARPEPAPTEPVEDAHSKIEIDEETVKELIKAEVELIQGREKDALELEGIRKDFETLSSELKDLKYNLDSLSSSMKSKMDNIQYESEFKRIDREINKFSEKIAEIMDEIGFGEQLNVSKIPPTILEIVYQATLDDLTIELSRVLGSQDAEKISRQALEEVRLKTSGSELFKFDGRKIVTDSLAYSIEANLISAKQIQTTYDELLSRLLENLPHHKAKNFRAMIKVKSQEFAVDRATMLTKETGRLEKSLERSSQMLAALSAQVNSLSLEIKEEIGEIKNNLLANKADASEIGFLKTKLKEREEREANLMKDVGLIKAEIEMKKKLPKDAKPAITKKDVPPEKALTDEKDEEKPKKDKEKAPADDGAKKEEPEKPDTSKLEASVLNAINKGASSKTALMRETGQEEKVVLDIISKLVKDKKVMEKKVGKRTKYLTPDKDIADKLKKEIKARDKAKAKSEAIKEPEKKEEKSEEPEPKGASKKKPKKKERKKLEAKEEKEIEKKQKKKTPAKAGAKKKKEAPPSEETPKEKPKDKKPEKKKEPVKKATKKKKEPKKAEEPKEEKEPPKAEPVPEEKEKARSEEKEELTPKDRPKEEGPEDTPKEKPPAKEKPKEEEIVVPDITKSLAELSDDEKHVLNVITDEGLTRSGIQSKVSKDMNYTRVLRALRVLIDSGYVGILTKGRLTLYQKIKVEKMDKPEKENNKKEVN